MKPISKLPIFLLITLLTVSCSDDVPSDYPFEGEPKDYFVFPKTEQIIVVDGNIDHIVVEGDVQYLRMIDRTYGLQIAKPQTTAVEGVHYVLPQNFEFLFKAYEALATINIAIKPKNITSEVKLVVVRKNRRDDKPMQKTDTMNITLTPLMPKL